jgi:hypothetical protein
MAERDSDSVRAESDSESDRNSVREGYAEARAAEAVDAAAHAVVAAIAEPWEAQLPFKIALGSDPREFDCADIFEYDRNIIWSGAKVYLHPTKYNSANEFKNLKDSDVSGWKELLLDLQKASKLSGEVLGSNGGGQDYRVLLCQRGRIYQGEKEKSDAANQQCRKQSLHNDRQNSRGPGGKGW